MRVALAADHAGYLLKQRLAARLRELGHTAVDFGTDSEEPVDYPLFIRPAALAVAGGDCERGVVIGGSGNGEAMVANRLRGARCALCWSVAVAQLARHHNDANVLALGARLTSEEEALAILEAFLATPFHGGRHARRVAQIDSP